MDREVEECIVTRDETKQILMRISSVYPNWKPQADLKFVVETWCEYLEEYSYEQIRAALKVYIATDTSGFAPSIGQLIDKLHTISRPQELSEMEAWELVSRALRNGYYGAEEEFEKLPSLVKKTVGSPSQLRNWSQTDSDSVENVIQSNFMRNYRTVVSREKEFQRLSSDIQRLVSNLRLEEKSGKE
ncbi:MAG: replicative helicase loader/inhibitor [Acetivibrio ethanolgignens]